MSTAEGLSKQERAAIKERAAEVRSPRKRMTKQEKAAQDVRDVEEKIASFEGSDKEIAERIHRIVTTVAPELAPKLWYGMPAYALEGNVLCFFQDARKFGARYATFGFNDHATLDDGQLWGTAFAITAVGAKEEEQLTALVRKAVGDRD